MTELGFLREKVRSGWVLTGHASSPTTTPYGLPVSAGALSTETIDFLLRDPNRSTQGNCAQPTHPTQFFQELWRHVELLSRPLECEQSIHDPLLTLWCLTSCLQTPVVLDWLSPVTYTRPL